MYNLYIMKEDETEIMLCGDTMDEILALIDLHKDGLERCTVERSR